MPEKKSTSRINSHIELAEWIEDCVLGDLRTLSYGINEFHKEKPEGLGEGNFLLLASSLMALEYIARVYSGKGDATSCVKDYSLKWLVPVNSKYSAAWKILWLAGRNGIIHGSWPYRLSFEKDNTEYRFIIGCEATDPHLLAKGNCIYVNSNVFLSDLSKSVANGFTDWLRACTDPSVLDRGQPRVHIISANDREGTDALKEIVSWKG